VSAPTPARRAAFETIRRVFEEDAWADRALRAAATRLGLEGRERAQAQALAYGAVQRRGTSDHFIAELTGRPVGRIDAPLLAALRLGLYELLYGAGGAEHAAVDQAVSLAKGRGGRRHGAGLVNAVLRRAARERAELLAGLDDAGPEGAAVAHSVPPWLAGRSSAPPRPGRSSPRSTSRRSGHCGPTGSAATVMPRSASSPRPASRRGRRGRTGRRRRRARSS
jgi:16S rRNA (cytosine967-C5)-methyltransferase